MQLFEVNVNEIKAKFQGKRDAWHFFAYEMRAYVPEEKCCTADFLRDLISGKKKGKNAQNTEHFIVYQE